MTKTQSNVEVLRVAESDTAVGDYTNVETDDLKRLADMYIRHHADAYDAYEASGSVDGSIWDRAMQEHMAHLRAIDAELVEREETAA